MCQWLLLTLAGACGQEAWVISGQGATRDLGQGPRGNAGSPGDGELGAGHGTGFKS